MHCAVLDGPSKCISTRKKITNVRGHFSQKFRMQDQFKLVTEMVTLVLHGRKI